LFWDFNQNGSLQGWRNSALLDLVLVENGVARFISRGARDPILESPDDLAINTEKSKVILVRMRQNSGSVIEVIWYKEEDGKLKDYVTRMGLMSDNEFHLYYIPVGDNPGWSGRIDYIRIDPVDCESELYIDLIAIPETISRTKEDLAAEIKRKIYLNLPGISRKSTIYLYLEHLNQWKDVFEILCKELPVQYGDSSLNVKSLNEIGDTQIPNNSFFLAYSNGDLIDFTDRILSVVWETQEKIKKYRSVRWDYKQKDVLPIYVDVEKILFPTILVGKFEVRMRILGKPGDKEAGIGSLSWNTNKGNGASTYLNSIPNGEFYTYFIDLQKNDKFKKSEGEMITWLKLSPAHTDIEEIEIDYLALNLINPVEMAKNFIVDKLKEEVKNGY